MAENLTIDFLHNYILKEVRTSDPIAYQYDLGRILVMMIPDTVSSVEVHYWKNGMSQSEAYNATVEAADKGSVVTAHVPNKYFETSGDLRVYVVIAESGQDATMYEGLIPIKERPMPDGYVDDDPDNEATRVLVEARAAAATATAAAQTAQDIADSIPADYSQMSADVDTLKADTTALKEELSVLNSFSVTWGQGNIIESNGASGGSAGSLYSKRLRTILTEVPDGGFAVDLPDNIQMQLFWYSANSTSSYIGCDILGDISNLDSPRGAWVRFVLAYSDATLAITPADADVANVHLYTPALTDTSLTLSGKAADAKATGDAIRAAFPAVITVDVNGGADYTSLTRAIYDNVSTGETIMVKPGTYDIVQEYVDLFGQSTVDSLADSTDLGGFQYGIHVYNRKVIFQPGAHVVCDWTGHTVNGTHRFSAFSIAYNAEIEGLDLDCTATFYAIHDDYGTYQVYYKNIYRNCRLIGHSLVNQNVIGGGCKPYSRTIIDSCYVDNNATGTCVRYHNTNLSQAAEPVVWVSNSYFAQAISFRWYGAQTTKMTAYVNNCHATSITKGAEGSATNDNVELYKWNNDETNPTT